MGTPFPPGVDDVTTASGWFHYWSVPLLTLAAVVGGVIGWLSRAVWRTGSRLMLNTETIANHEVRLRTIEGAASHMATRDEIAEFRREAKNETADFRRETREQLGHMSALLASLISAIKRD